MTQMNGLVTNLQQTIGRNRSPDHHGHGVVTVKPVAVAAMTGATRNHPPQDTGGGICKLPGCCRAARKSFNPGMRCLSPFGICLPGPDLYPRV